MGQKKRSPLTEEFAEGLFDLADGMEGDVVFLRVEALEIIFRNDDIAEA